MNVKSRHTSGMDKGTWWQRFQGNWCLWRYRKRAQSWGEGAIVLGAPQFKNDGQLFIGDRLVWRSDLVRSRIAISHNAQLTIGEDCWLHGSIIAATHSITIGDNVWMAPGVHLMDSDFHDLQDRSQAGAAAPIVIEDNVRLETKVVVLRGVTIGAGATVGAGSVVTKDVPAGSYVSGIPAQERER